MIPLMEAYRLGKSVYSCSNQPHLKTRGQYDHSIFKYGDKATHCPGRYWYCWIQLFTRRLAQRFASLMFLEDFYKAAQCSWFRISEIQWDRFCITISILAEKNVYYEDVTSVWGLYQTNMLFLHLGSKICWPEHLWSLSRFGHDVFLILFSLINPLRSSVPGSFISPIFIGVKWMSMFDCWFRKVVRMIGHSLQLQNSQSCR